MVGGTICCVAVCKNSFGKAKHSGETISFFSFPKELKLQKEWIRNCYRKDKWSVTNKRICSKHFKLSDFEDEMEARIMNTKPKRLKKDAVPSLHLLPGCEQPGVSERSLRMAQKEKKLIIEALLKEEEVSIGISEVSLEASNNLSLTTSESDCDIWKRKIEALQEENTSMRRELEALQEENTSLRRKLGEHENRTKNLENHIFLLNEQIKKENIGFEDKAKQVFKDFLTPNQVEIALQKKTKARWSQEDLSRAFTLRYFSKRAYIYLRNTMHYPLPGITTLQKWASNVNLTNGILEDVFNIMEIAGKTKTNLFRTTVLSYDEVKISSLYEYYQKNDEIMGPYSYMQVVMARGLFNNWKQPLYIGFDQKMTKQILESIITRLNEISYQVVACVSDCGGSNQGLWKALGISDETVTIAHPVSKKPIFFFADVPHLLKLIRNWFLDTGFLLNDGSLINVEPVKKLIVGSRTEISSCYKLTEHHLTCEKAQRQNVRLAAQLFSNTTATALKYYLPEDKQVAQNTGDFFQLVNDWFDVMNSYSPSSNIPSKKPYGFCLEKQNEILDSMITTIGGMKCVRKKSLQAFQKAIIMSTKSIKGLLQFLKHEFGIKYILTHRLNQDCLENFFGQIRTRGGLHDHPSPLDAIYRIRMILLGKNPGIVTAHSNIESSPTLEEGDYLMAMTLKQAKLGDIKIPEELSLPLPDPADDTSSTTSSSAASIYSNAPDNPERPKSEMDGLEYIAGYLAKKHKEKYPELGKYTHQNQSLHSYSQIPSWIQNLSFGGLIEPSREWRSTVFKMDKYFQKLHNNDDFGFKKEIMVKTTKYIARKLKDIPKDLIKSFCRQRVFVRIKYLNMRREEKSVKRKNPSELRKNAKKMKKTVN